MAIFYTDTGSFGKVSVSGSGNSIFSISGSNGSLLDVSDITAGANVFQLTSASVDIFKIDQSKNVQVSGSLIVTGSIFLNGSSVGAGGGGGLVVAAGGSTNTVSQLVFSNGGGISFGLNGSTITATEGAFRSYYENIPLVASTTTLTLGSNSMFMMPFMLPYDVSVSYIRMPISNQFTAQTIATTNNTTANLRQTQTFWFNIYSAGNGVSSKSLQLYTQASATMVYAITAQQGAATANQSVSQALTYFAEGLTTNTFSTSYATGATNLSINTNNLTAFTGNRWMDIPFNNSLASGMWWAGIQRSTATATTGGAAGLSTMTNNMSFHAATQANQNYNLIGAAAANTNALAPGLGLATVSANGATSNSIGLTNINTQASQLKIPFQFLRFE